MLSFFFALLCAGKEACFERECNRKFRCKSSCNMSVEYRWVTFAELRHRRKWGNLQCHSKFEQTGESRHTALKFVQNALVSFFRWLSNECKQALVKTKLYLQWYFYKLDAFAAFSQLGEYYSNVRNIFTTEVKAERKFLKNNIWQRCLEFS